MHVSFCLSRLYAKQNFSKCLQNVFRNKILSGQGLQMLGIYSFCVISVSMSKHNVKQYFQKW